MDGIYPALEKSEASLPKDLVVSSGGREEYEPLRVDADENRPARTTEDMEKEAIWLKSLFDKQD